MSNKIKCLFGYHKYTIPKVLTGLGSILVCKHCQRFGYMNWEGCYEVWYEFDKNGKLISWKD